jgi:hypothetical protein
MRNFETSVMDANAARKNEHNAIPPIFLRAPGGMISTDEAFRLFD